MSAKLNPVLEPLPKSHLFLTLSRGRAMRTFALPIVVVYVLACVLPLLGLVGAGATAYVVFHDNVVASLMARQTQIQYAYEDRLDAMRGELQRQTAHATSERDLFDSRLQDLMSRESRLENRAAVVASLATMTGLTAGGQAAVTGDNRISNPLAAMQPALPARPPAALGYATAPAPSPFPRAAKPRPEADPVAAPPHPPESLSAIDPVGLPLQTRLSLASAAFDKVERLQVGALVRIGTAARQETARLEDTLEDVGLSADRFRRDPPADQGGPFVPLPADRGTPFGDAIANLQDTLASAAHLRGVVTRVPLADPLPGVPEVTSPFGARLDPFLGRPALHTGVDLKEGYGAEVKATAGGRVVFAGTAGGYGNMVEVDHGNGLVTRYAHMEEVLVDEGQTVERNAIVGRVGATGRATGPHLHYEIRVDGEPVDPLRFLNVGFRMADALGH